MRLCQHRLGIEPVHCSQACLSVSQCTGFDSKRDHRHCSPDRAVTVSKELFDKY